MALRAAETEFVVVCVYANARCHKEQAPMRKCVVSVLLTNPYRIRVSGGLTIPTQ